MAKFEALALILWTDRRRLLCLLPQSSKWLL